MWSQDTASNSVWGDHVPSLPAMPSSRDRCCPLQGRPAVTRVLPPLLGQASSRTAFQTSPCLQPSAEARGQQPSAPQQQPLLVAPSVLLGL